MISQRKFRVAVLCFVLNFAFPEVSCDTCDVFPLGQCPNDPFRTDKTYCCKDNGVSYCCDLEDFTKNVGMNLIVPVLASLAVVFLLTCCLCCFCCPCCLLYKRRHNGTVYGRVQPPTTVVTVQQPAPAYPAMPIGQPMGAPMPQPGMPGYIPPAGYPAMQGQQVQAAPPPYNIAVANEGYVKQAPYNPNY